MIGRYRAHLETELLKQEQLLKGIIADKERTILWLRQQLDRERARADRLESYIPGFRPRIEQPKTTAKTATTDSGEGSWLTFLNKHMEQQEKVEKQAKEKVNGVSIQIGADVHESASGNAGGQNGGSTPKSPAGSPAKSIA